MKRQKTEKKKLTTAYLKISPTRKKVRVKNKLLSTLMKYSATFWELSATRKTVRVNNKRVRSTLMKYLATF